MYEESIVEKGIVLSAQRGLAEIALLETESCEACSAKLFCKPSSKDDTKVLEVSDPYGVLPGDEVQIKIAGRAVLKASVMLYGFPLLLIITGILTGMYLFSSTSLPELFSFVLGLGLTSVYVGGLFLIKKIKKSRPVLPQIVFVKRP